MSISISIFSALELAGYPGRALAAPSASTLFTPTDDAHYGSTKVFDGRIGDPGRGGHCAHGGCLKKNSAMAAGVGPSPTCSIGAPIPFAAFSGSSIRPAKMPTT